MTDVDDPPLTRRTRTRRRPSSYELAGSTYHVYGSSIEVFVRRGPVCVCPPRISRLVRNSVTIGSFVASPLSRISVLSLLSRG